MEKKHATRRYVDEFKKKRQEWKDQEKQRLEEENVRILEFARMQQAREEDRMESKRQEEEAKALVQAKVSVNKEVRRGNQVFFDNFVTLWVHQPFSQLCMEGFHMEGDLLRL